MGEPLEDYCQRRFGGAVGGRIDMFRSEADGARFSDWKWWPNTSKAHQLIQYCESNGISSTDRVNALLFQAEYERGENISLVDVLVRVGQEAGVTDVTTTTNDDDKNSGNNNSNNNSNLDDLRKYLTEDEGKVQVQRDIARGRKLYGISSVPYFIVSADHEEAADDSSSSSSDKNRGTRTRQRPPYGFSGAQSSDTFLELFEEIAEQQQSS